MRILLSIIVLSTLIFSSISASNDTMTYLRLKWAPQKSLSVTLSTLKNPLTLTYKSDTAKLSDTITITQKGKKTRILHGPISQYSKSKRAEILKCVSLWKSNCLETFRLGTIDPSGKYFEMHMQGFQKEGWSLLSIATGKALISNDTGIQDSTWSSDGREFAWVTTPCILKKCMSKRGVYFSKTSDFSKAMKVTDLNEYSLGYRLMMDSDSLIVLEKKNKTQNILRVYDKKTGELTGEVKETL